ncbi:MAG TPA: type I restriction endonuclease subunit R [Ruminococcaceae bacterium]|nr:type I restriction endonuclease subunit R [Oscillospiraceae bacterium]
MNASLNEKLKNIEWGEYRLGELFEIYNTLSFNTDMLVDGKKYDYVTRTSFNQGVLRTTGFVNKTNINSAGTWSLGLLQMDFFYRSKEWYAGQFVRKIVPKIEIPQEAVMFFTTVLNKQKKALLSVLVRDVDETFRETIVRLPIKNNKIDFDFMKSFIAELEAERIAELEAERIAELSAYLKVSGFDNYELSAQELKALENLKAISWEEYRIGKLFDKIKTKKLAYKAKELPNTPTGKFVLPCLTSSFQNQGLNYYVPKAGASILKNVITIPQNSDVYRAYYQSNDFTVLSDAYAMDWIYDDNKLTRNQYLFIVMCINKVTDLPIYSYKNKLGGWNVVKDKYILLPSTNGKIDLDFMNEFISAIIKLAIKDVVIYSDRKIKATKDVVSK